MNLVKKWTEKYAANTIIVFLTVFTLINPFPHTTTIREVCFYGAVLGLVLLFIANKKQLDLLRTPLFIPMGLFIIWVVFAFIFALDKQNSWHDMYTFLFRYTLLGVMFAIFFKDPVKMRFLSWLIVISLSVFLSIALVKYYRPGANGFSIRFFASNEGMTYNLISISIIFSCFLLYCNVASTRNFWRYPALLLYFPLLAALVLSQARSAFIALAVSSLVFVFVRHKIMVMVLVAALSAIFFFTPLNGRFNADLTKDPRLSHALLVLEVVKDHPLTGIGFGMETFAKLDLPGYKARMEEKSDVKYFNNIVLNDPHCMYTDILVRTGIIGFALFSFILYSLFKMVWIVSHAEDPLRRLWAAGMGCSLLSFLIVAAFEPVFSHVQVYYMTLMISFISILWRQHQEVG